MGSDCQSGSRAQRSLRRLRLHVVARAKPRCILKTSTLQDHHCFLVCSFLVSSLRHTLSFDCRRQYYCRNQVVDTIGTAGSYCSETEETLRSFLQKAIAPRVGCALKYLGRYFTFLKTIGIYGMSVCDHAHLAR